MQKSYYAIIPANVRYCKRLTPNAKLLYGEITALCNEKGYCWANNSYFSELYSVSKTSISKWISQLSNEGFIDVKMNYKENSKEVESRYISLIQYPIEEKLNTPIEEKLKDNNTLINNTYTQEQFLKRWKDARKHYLKKPTHITELKFHQKERFNKLVKNYGSKEFDLAIKGLFENSTYGQTTLNPNHFLEEFEQYYTAAVSGEKLFGFKKENKESSKKGMI